MFQSINAYKL